MTGMGKEGCLASVARTRFSQAEKKWVEVGWVEVVCAKAAVERSARRQRESGRRALRGMQAFWPHESRAMDARTSIWIHAEVDLSYRASVGKAVALHIHQ